MTLPVAMDLVQMACRGSEAAGDAYTDLMNYFGDAETQLAAAREENETLKRQWNDQARFWNSQTLKDGAEILRLRAALEKIRDGAKRAYEDDRDKFLAAPAGNPGGVWNEHTKHTQTFGWMVGCVNEALTPAAAPKPQEGGEMQPWSCLKCGSKHRADEPHCKCGPEYARLAVFPPHAPSPAETRGEGWPDEMYEWCYSAMKHADSGKYQRATNGWMTMFADKMSEHMRRWLTSLRGGGT